MDHPVRVSLLGPLEVRDDGRQTPVIGIKLQSLLAMLALAVPHVVSDDRLLDELWGDEQPAKPANALQALVSHLRRLLGRDVVVRQGAGYALRLDPDVVDISRLEHLVGDGRAASTRGDHAGAADSYRAAIALVRGPPLGELLDRWFARDAIARLEDLILAAHEGLVDAELATGRHADVLGRLADLVTRHPLRERFRAQLIIALYRCGRQAEALQAYHDARDHLLDELGLDPGPELQALERSVLAHDPALAAPIPLTPGVPPRPFVPVPLTSFVGRQPELGALADAVATARLTSVVGPGGVGKTRLVLELAARLAEQREVWFVELAPVTHEAAVAEAVAAALGAQERSPAGGGPPPSAEQRAVARLGRREVVVVLDNCEHVAAAAASSALALLAGCPRARIVTTGREPLAIEGERQVVVGPLDDDSSAELFVERARAVQPQFPTERRAELIELCRHLDGLPLAIELAAARAKTLAVPEIADRLHDRFRLLRHTQRAGTSRHQGLEAAIDWSYELLFEDERRAFRRLAVCSGGATIEMAERLCGPDAFEVASRLVDRSLLVADPSRRATRFDMLESLRAYGIERLAETGELAAARADHLQWCIELAQRVDVEARGPDQIRWLERLDDEHDNVCAALGYAVEHDPAGALRLAGAVILPWWYRGRRQETRRWAEASLAAGSHQPPRLRWRVLAYSGLVAEPTRLEDDDHTVELHDALAVAEARQREAIGLARDDETASAYAQLLLLNTLMRRAASGEAIDTDEFAALVAASAAVFDRTGDHYGSAVARVTDALQAVTVGDVNRARAAVAAATTYARRGGERFAASRVEYILGMLDDLDGDPAGAYRHIERSLRMLDELGIHQAVTAQARLLAPLAERRGEPELAAQWRRFVSDRGGGWTHYDGTVMASAHNHEGLDARAAGDLERAAIAHTGALEWYAAAGLPAGVAFSESSLGFLTAERGDRAAAARHHDHALSAALAGEDAPRLALALEGCAGTATDAVRGAMLLGAASRLWADTPEPTRTHRADVSSIAASARQALGDAAFDAAWRDGARLDRRAVVALAGKGRQEGRSSSGVWASDGGCQSTVTMMRQARSRNSPAAASPATRRGGS